jgi:NAD(P)-dependent dehydrogenase (short-subunit alcohol dehydrogenase family)
VTDRASVEGVVAAAEADLGPVDILVNSAGVARLAPAEEMSDEFWDLTMAVNVKGTFLTSQILGRRMLQRGDGTIINLASQAASVALADHVAYCASKAGVIGLTKVLASEWAGRGVRVNAISPTVVLTPLGREAWLNAKGDALLTQIPVGRFAEPEEVAALAAFLASRSSSMLNGADIVIDGGYTIR